MDRDRGATEELTAIGALAHQLGRVLPGQPDCDAVKAVDELFPQGRARTDHLFRCGALIVLSSSIASFGLLADSSAVVIGAMLVAPLMMPILAAAAATVRP